MEELTKYMIAVPCMNNMPAQFVSSLVFMERVGASRVSFVQNSMVYDARNWLAAEALDTGADRILWLDSDMEFHADLMKRLAAHLDDGKDFITGLYFGRRLPMVPMISIPAGEGHLRPYIDYPKDQLFEIKAAGFGVCMMTRKILQDVWDNFGSPFYPADGHGEDYSFCNRATALGYKLYCDSRIKAGHVGQFIYNEHAYLSQGGK